MEGLSGFDRSMVKRLESSALAFYELKHQQHQQQYQELQCRARSICAEAEKTKTAMKCQRQASDASSSSSSPDFQISSEQISSDAVLTSGGVRRGHLPGTSDTEDDVPVTGNPTELAASTYGDNGDRSPRPTADRPSGTTSNSSISFSINRILGHDNTSLAGSRRLGSVHHCSAGRSTTPVHAVERSRSQSGMASPDSSCRVVGDDLDHDVKTLNDVDSDDNDMNDNDVMLKLQTQSPATAAAAVMSGDTLHRLSWLQCTRYKPPKLPSKNLARNDY